MGYIKRIVCLANSYKHGGACIAGREITPHGYGPWIRPVSPRATQELYLAECHCPGTGSPRLLDVVDIPLHAPAPHHHQSENHLIDGSLTWAKRGELAFTELQKIWQHPPCLWSNTDCTGSGRFDCISDVEAHAHANSLYLLKLPSLTVETRIGRYTQKMQYRARFRHNGTDYNLSLTDQAARDRLDRKPPGEFHVAPSSGLYVTISLTEPYSEDGRCHKLVAAILLNRTGSA
jgi:hypothetical protein